MSFNSGRRPGSSSGVIAPVAAVNPPPRPAEISHKVNQIKVEFDQAFMRM